MEVGDCFSKFSLGFKEGLHKVGKPFTSQLVPCCRMAQGCKPNMVLYRFS